MDVEQARDRAFLEDLPDGLEALELTVDDRSWLLLKGFDGWRGGPESLNRQVTRWITCFVIRRADLKEIRETVDYWQGRYDRATSGSQGIRTFFVVPK